ncbi:putative fatty acyl-CoA reductase CG5065 isoform X2 [Linepithema humile]|uniref:putative fatty acyl-CoA reductase CG5065 isoform X2 n=1 Tax=Linepithema humile TaxID=83485 RepID=UPI00351F1158
MDKKRSEIQSYYKNKTIFVTGASGFMGKVLLEKLLYSCSEIDKIYIIIRSKKGHNIDTRLSNIFDLPLFQRIKIEKPNVLQKVIPLNGDITSDNLGLTEEQRERLINEVHVVFHCAASTRFDTKLKDAIELNTISTKRVLDLAKQIKQLECFLHVSTTFCHVEQKELAECTYDSPHNPHHVMKLVQWLDEEAIDLLTPKLMHPHPNSYTYSKCLAETLVVNEYPNLPCCIARPSIAIEEPLPGWVDNLNGIVGLLIAAGKGVVRSMHCNGRYHIEAIPVDIAINNLIVIAYRVGTKQEKSKSIPVFNVTQGRITEMTFDETLELGRRVYYEYPFDGQVWYPDGNIRSNKFVHNLFVFFFHIIPAYFIDFLMLIFRQKRFMVKLQKRISAGLEVLQYFTTRKWIFYNNKITTIFDELSPEDKKLFRTYIDSNSDKIEYTKNCILGARQYCLKEDLSSLPRARRHQKIMYVLHITTVYLFYFGILYYIYNNFEIMKISLDYITEKLKLLPIIGGFVEKAHL